MELMQRRRELMAMQKKGRLPSIYQEVEWVESSGYAYLQFPIVIQTNSTLDAEIKVKYTGPLTSNYWLAGSFAGNDGASLEFGTVNGRDWYVPNGSITTYTHEPLMTIIQSTRAYQSTQTINFCICGRYYSGLADNIKYFETRFFSLKIKIDNQIINEIVPCFRKSDGTIGAYDVVTGTFLINLNSVGSFTKGADV